MHDTAVEHQFLRFRVADTAAELSRHAVLDIEIDIDHIRDAGHRRIVDFDILDIGQTLQQDLGALHELVRKVRTFHLPHLATQYLVINFTHAMEVDAPNINPTVGCDEERDLRFLGFVVQFGNRLDLGICIALLTQPE